MIISLSKNLQKTFNINLNKNILKKEVQQFIEDHINTDINKLLLKPSPFQNISVTELVNQIICKTKSKTKLPSWYENKDIIYPTPLNIEQTSSEITAQYKSELVKGKYLVDLSGGFGVDTYYFSKQFEKVIHIEYNNQLSEIANHNFKVLGSNNIETHCADSLKLLPKLVDQIDCIYVDPSRRHDLKGKVFLFNDCVPSVVKHIELLFKVSKVILIKSSPLVDLKSGINELKHVAVIYIVAVKNEVKELLWLLDKNKKKPIEIVTYNYKSSSLSNETFSFDYLQEFHQDVIYKEPLNFLYEPNHAILKSGGFKMVAKIFNVYKLEKNSHLYTSDKLVNNFPGRQFKILEIFNSLNKDLKQFKNRKINISTRNFPMSVSEIRKKFKILDGGELYIFFTTNLLGSKTALLCEKA